MKKTYQAPETLLVTVNNEYHLLDGSPTPSSTQRQSNVGSDFPTAITEGDGFGNGQSGKGTPSARSKEWDFVGGMWDD